MHPETFKIFGFSHLAVLFLMFLAAAAIIAVVRKRKNSEKACSLFLLILLIFSTLLAYYLKAVNGWLSIQYDLMMHLCDWALIAVIITLIKKNLYTFELSYFWGLGGTLQALLTPDITEDFPSISFFLFFLSHCIIIISILYFTLGLNMRPYPKSIIRVFLWSQVYFVFAYLVNILTGANYGYLMHKPSNSSVIDYLGPWPYYLISLEFIAFFSFCLYYLPFYLKDKFFPVRIKP